jgi:hypothetical protein
MVNLKNFKSIKCLEKGCNVIPSYNYKNEKEVLYCSKHKKEGMIILIKKTCIHENCDKIPFYNFENKTTALYCS